VGADAGGRAPATPNPAPLHALHHAHVVQGGHQMLGAPARAVAGGHVGGERGSERVESRGVAAPAAAAVHGRWAGGRDVCAEAGREWAWQTVASNKKRKTCAPPRTLSSLVSAATTESS
jgi:hypothetical protein